MRDEKWQQELNQHFSINFWDDARKLNASINFDNSLKWLQYQIIRNSLQTNYIVSHFRPDVSSICSYCQSENSSEKISHLFWTCLRVSEFLDEVFIFMANSGIVYQPTKIDFLFGFTKEKFYGLNNYISLIIKKYIWLTKFRTGVLSLVAFKSLLKSYLEDLKYIFAMKDMPEVFTEWNMIYNML